MFSLTVQDLRLVTFKLFGILGPITLDSGAAKSRLRLCRFLI